ncbi:MAG: 30S ribosomal protein S4 [Candidatus Harrisonbacteria bacterium CG10_big_fil_rev_8_21_14_0_10_49_15]|uniref:Small ribosomal subunit protein uS4 n=1 Tax=Candidatus Harrisonbacteria bacterium CG10_big_fil_rev_8_21_14_0_10_49_15 TaxID=1974587 RepID=A0A2H0UJR8_9BACT|nr:MAG: 30S ribosomal protein S4 [Candidatus Harrisonbacteria bacterium CG10_big_fil_rev_8_21_14_0_10_49_15]
MFKSTSKKERRLGIPLFLKPHRSAGSKSAMVRRPHRPGQHGKARRRAPSEFGEQLAEKQKFRYAYGLREKQMVNYFKIASKNPGNTGPAFIGLLERRLDNIVFRLGLAPSRSVARQLVSHGHIFVNGRRVKSSAYIVKVGNKIGVRPQSKEIAQIKEAAETLEKHDAPTWLKLDAKAIEGEVLAIPHEFDIAFDISKVVDYYSKTVK